MAGRKKWKYKHDQHKQHCDSKCSNVVFEDKRNLMVILAGYISRLYWLIWEHLFVTEANLQHELNELTTEAKNHSTLDTMSEPLSVEVSEMNKKKLTIKIKKSSSIEEEIEDELDGTPSSADIEIVYNKVCPNLHGILKQRSISESSDDICSLNSSSPLSLSPQDDFAQRKSVSFSERVDKTSYKQHASVSSMKTALKSKRRRARKRDERRGRQRHNSYGSESSSGTEELEQRSVSDSECLESVSENISVFGKLAGVNSCVAEAARETCIPKVSKWESLGGLDGDAASNKFSQSENDNNVCHTIDNIVSEVEEGDDFSNEKSESHEMIANRDVEKREMTSSVSVVGNSENHVERTEKLKISDVKNGEVTSIVDVENHDNVDSEELPAVIKSKDSDDLIEKIVPPSSSEMIGAVLVPGYAVLDERTNVADDGYVSSSSSPGMLNAQKTDILKEDFCENGKAAEETKSEVETHLNWSDKSQSQSQEASNEHKTQCAFGFTNSVIFELDID